MRQFQLQAGNVRTACWLEDDKRLQVGSLVTLKTSDDPEKWWTIIRRGETTTELGKIHKKWTESNH